MMPDDWSKIDREYRVKDETGAVLFENKMESCANVGPYKTCRYHLSAENPRIGLMMAKGAYGLMTYVAKWVVPK